MMNQLFCPTCEDYRVVAVQTRDETYRVRGLEITVPVEQQICRECGEAIGTDEDDQAVLNAVHAEYRRLTDFLTPERIKSIRQQYRLSQRSFASLLGMSEATINRYEQGGLQDNAHDELIRGCENTAVMRDILDRRGHILTAFQLKRAKEALEGRDGQADTGMAVMQQIPGVDVRIIDMLAKGRIGEANGFRRFDFNRFAAVVRWFCERLGPVSSTTINKLLFYADFLNFKYATVSITGSPYQRHKFGPVPASYGLLFDMMLTQGLITAEERVFGSNIVGTYYQAGNHAVSFDSDLSTKEIRVLEVVANTIGNLSAQAVSDRSHQEQAWLETPDRQLISYQHAMQLTLSLNDT